MTFYENLYLIYIALGILKFFFWLIGLKIVMLKKKMSKLFYRYKSLEGKNKDNFVKVGLLLLAAKFYYW